LNERNQGELGDGAVRGGQQRSSHWPELQRLRERSTRTVKRAVNPRQKNDPAREVEQKMLRARNWRKRREQKKYDERNEGSAERSPRGVCCGNV
jgi:hypothetical protein